MEEKKYENENSSNNNNMISSTIFDNLFINSQDSKKEEIIPEDGDTFLTKGLQNKEGPVENETTKDFISTESQENISADSNGKQTFEVVEQETNNEEPKDVWMEEPPSDGILNLQAQLPHITISDIDENDIFVNEEIKEEIPTNEEKNTDIWVENSEDSLKQEEMDEAETLDNELPNTHEEKVEDVFVENNESANTIIDPIFEKWKRTREMASKEENIEEEKTEPPIEFHNTIDEQMPLEDTFILDANQSNIESADKKESNPDSANKQTAIDYFSYNFEESETNNQNNNSTPVQHNFSNQETPLQFDFYNTIRTQNEVPQLPQEECVEQE